MNTMSAQAAAETLRSAVRHHQAGRYTEAEQLYRRLLADFPRHPDVLRLLGVIAGHRGNHDEAITLLRRAIDSAPKFAPVHSDLGDALLRSGRQDEALASYRRAISVDPGFAEGHNNLGNALRALGQPEAAVACFRRALELRPAFPEAHNNLGMTLAELGRTEPARQHLEQALALKPDFPQAHNNLGLLFNNLGHADDAIACLERALALAPGYVEALSNLGNALLAAGRHSDAEAAYRRALSLRPDHPETHNNLGQLFESLGHGTEALECYRRAISCREDFAEARWNIALAYLRQGDFESGWREYEWRWKALGRRRLVRDFREPRWDGDTPLAGRTLLLHYEQGLGDTIQMLRYLPLLAERGARVVLEVPPPLATLAATVPGNATVLVEGTPLPEIDLQCPVMSLPRAFGTTLATIPDNVPYVHAAASARETWRHRLGSSTRRRIGLAWSGSPGHGNDRRRSIAFAQLLPLLEADADFVSLQPEYRPADRALVAADGHILDCADQLTDFAATAGLVEQLDLVITVDTSVAHLAGAMGRPVWVMLPFAADYRWMTEREDSPWYPTMRLFRQPSPGDWGSVIARIIATIGQLPPHRAPASPRHGAH